MNDANLKNNFTLYRKKIALLNDYEERLMIKENFDHWMELIDERNDFILSFQQFNKEFKELFASIKNPDILYEEIKSNYLAGFLEPFFNEEFIDYLIPYYEKQEDHEKLIFLYSFAGLIYSDIARTEDKEAAKMSAYYYELVMNYKDSDVIFEDKMSMSFFYASFYNYIVVLPTIDAIEIGQAFAAYKLFIELRNDERYRLFDEDLPFIHRVCGLIEKEFPRIAYFVYNEAKVNDQTLHDYAKSLSYNVYLEDVKNTQNDNINIIKYFSFFTYRYMLAYEGDITFNEAYLQMNEFFNKHLDKMYYLLKLANDPAGLLCNTFTITMIMLDKADFSKDFKKEAVIRYTDYIMDMIDNFPKGRLSSELNSVAQEIGFNKMVHSLIDDPKISEKIIFNFIASRHINTYIHSIMVNILSIKVLKFIIENNPELLIGFNGYKTIEEVASCKNDILEYCNIASLLHDIGKNAMINIVGTKYRPLTNRERIIIKRHPELGVNFLKNIANFEIYDDVILGHHKSYDGKTGYPESFNPINSQRRIIVDIVRICDCLDAGTDYINRNYKHANKYEELIEQLVAGKNTEYNPYIVDIIVNNKELSDSLRNVVGVERKAIYYKTYKDFLNKDVSYVNIIDYQNMF